MIRRQQFCQAMQAFLDSNPPEVSAEAFINYLRDMLEAGTSAWANDIFKHDVEWDSTMGMECCLCLPICGFTAQSRGLLGPDSENVKRLRALLENIARSVPLRAKAPTDQLPEALREQIAAITDATQKMDFIHYQIIAIVQAIGDKSLIFRNQAQETLLLQMLLNSEEESEKIKKYKEDIQTKLEELLSSYKPNSPQQWWVVLCRVIESVEVPVRLLVLFGGLFWRANIGLRALALFNISVLFPIFFKAISEWAGTGEGAQAKEESVTGLLRHLFDEVDLSIPVEPAVEEQRAGVAFILSTPERREQFIAIVKHLGMEGLVTILQTVKAGNYSRLYGAQAPMVVLQQELTALLSQPNSAVIEPAVSNAALSSAQHLYKAGDDRFRGLLGRMTGQTQAASAGIVARFPIPGDFEAFLNAIVKNELNTAELGLDRDERCLYELLALLFDKTISATQCLARTFAIQDYVPLGSGLLPLEFYHFLKELEAFGFSRNSPLRAHLREIGAKDEGLNAPCRLQPLLRPSREERALFASRAAVITRLRGSIVEAEAGNSNPIRLSIEETLAKIWEFLNTNEPEFSVSWREFTNVACLPSMLDEFQVKAVLQDFCAYIMGRAHPALLALQDVIFRMEWSVLKKMLFVERFCAKTIIMRDYQEWAAAPFPIDATQTNRDPQQRAWLAQRVDSAIEKKIQDNEELDENALAQSMVHLLKRVRSAMHAAFFRQENSDSIKTGDDETPFVRIICAALYCANLSLGDEQNDSSDLLGRAILAQNKEYARRSFDEMRSELNLRIRGDFALMAADGSFRAVMNTEYSIARLQLLNPDPSTTSPTMQSLRDVVAAEAQRNLGNASEPSRPAGRATMTQAIENFRVVHDFMKNPVKNRARLQDLRKKLHGEPCWEATATVTGYLIFLLGIVCLFSGVGLPLSLGLIAGAVVILAGVQVADSKRRSPIVKAMDASIKEAEKNGQGPKTGSEGDIDEAEEMVKGTATTATATPVSKGAPRDSSSLSARLSNFVGSIFSVSRSSAKKASTPGFERVVVPPLKGSSALVL